MILKIYNNRPDDFEEFEIPYTVIINSFLDEELDISPIELKHLARADPFPPFTVASLQEIEDDEPTYWMVGSDDVLTNVATERSDHVIQLIEPTKWLERFMVGNKTVTQSISADYAIDPSPVPPNPVETRFTWMFGDDETAAASIKEEYELFQYKSPVLWRENAAFYILPPFAFNGPGGISVAGKDGVTETVTLTREGSAVWTKQWGFEGKTSGYKKDPLVELYLPGPGSYTINYHFVKPKDAFTKTHFFASYDIAAVTNANVKPRTLKDAAMSMICAVEILKVSDKTPRPRFMLNDAIGIDLDGIVSPEITVTNATLREALDEIGMCIGAITVLDVHPSPDGTSFEYEITYEKYCKEASATLACLGEPYEIRKKAACDDYATLLDSTVEGLVQYDAGGSLYDPSFQLWRTTRSEDATYRVTEGTAEIFTTFPIERIDNLLCAIEKDGALVARDITSYVFESSEYASLSSYSSAYPYSKALALCYTLGQKNITGLNFTVPNPVHEIFEKAAIVNIINREFEDLGISFGAFKELDFTKLLFRVKYVPTGAARVRMRKPNSYEKNESTLSYSQKSAKLDADAFGRSMLGTLLRTGNPETVYSYVTPLGTKIPSKGERVDGNGYISAITEECAPQHKKIMLTVTEGFNRLSQRVGVDKSQRLFEIPERLCLDRHIVYEDKCLISTEQKPHLTGAIAELGFLSYLASAFSTRANSAVGWFATVLGYDENDKPLCPCTLPCLTYAMGTALLFTLSFEDNYSAGRRIDTPPQPIDESEDPIGYYTTETDVRYVDAFGRIASLELRISGEISEGHVANMTTVDYLDVANSLPAYPEVLSRVEGPAILAQDANRLYIDKDSREAIKTLTYQISFLEDDGIKISPWFVEHLPYVGRPTIIAIVPISKSENAVTNLTEWVKVSYGESTAIPAATASLEDSKTLKVSFSFEEESAGWAAVAWNENVGGNCYRKRFLFGKNVRVSAGTTVEIYFNFFH